MTIWQTDTVREAVLEANRLLAGYKAAQFGAFVTQCGPRVPLESPIEAVFWIYWQLFVACYVDTPTLSVQVPVCLAGQNYRLDFALLEHRIGIELDGHDFHEKTKEQVAYRNRRDRVFQRHGWRMLHFSGAELLRDPVAVIYEILPAAEHAAEYQAGVSARGTT